MHFELYPASCTILKSKRYGKNQLQDLLFLRKNVVNKNGESEIFLRLTVNKEAAQISTKATCAVGDLGARRSGKMRGKTKKANQLNDFLAEIRAAILFHIQEMERRDEIVTLEMRQRTPHLGISARAETLMEIFQKWLDNAESSSM